MRSTGTDLRVRAADDPPSLLVLVFDLDGWSWLRACGGSAGAALQKLGETCECVIGFVNAFQLLHSGNRAVLLTVSGSGHNLVYPSSDGDAIPDQALFGGSDTTTAPESDLRVLLSAAVRAAAVASAEQGPQRAPRIAAALARALCVVNRARTLATAAHPRGRSGGAQAQLQARVLALLAGNDDPAQYVPVMNCFFSAQRMKVPIDACVVGGAETRSTYFQQAANLTNGVYFRPQEDALLQTLLTVFLPDQLSRDFLAMPVPGEVDFRASCFDTRKVIDNGYTCSVCLSTFDSSVKKNAAMCKVCGARFAVAQGNARRR